MSGRRALHLVHPAHASGVPCVSAPEGRSSHAAADQARLLACYEAIADATRAMVEAARAYDWTTLHDCGRACEASMQRIEAMPAPQVVLDGEGRRRRVELLRQVLRDDARLRDLLDPARRCAARTVAPMHAAPQA